MHVGVTGTNAFGFGGQNCVAIFAAPQSVPAKR